MGGIRHCFKKVKEAGKEALLYAAPVLKPALEAAVMIGACYPGAGWVVSSVAALGAYGVDQLEKHEDRKENRRKEQEALDEAARQKELAHKQIEAHELAEKEALSVLSPETAVEIEAEITSNHAAAHEFIDQQHANVANDIQYGYAVQRDIITHQPGPKVAIGVSANAGTTGANLNFTYGAGTPGKMGGGSVPIYNYDFSRSSIEGPKAEEPASNWPQRSYDPEVNIPNADIAIEHSTSELSDENLQYNVTASGEGLSFSPQQPWQAGSLLDSRDYLTSPGFIYTNQNTGTTTVQLTAHEYNKAQQLVQQKRDLEDRVVVLRQEYATQCAHIAEQRSKHSWSEKTVEQALQGASAPLLKAENSLAACNQQLGKILGGDITPTLSQAGFRKYQQDNAQLSLAMQRRNIEVFTKSHFELARNNYVTAVRHNYERNGGDLNSALAAATDERKTFEVYREEYLKQLIYFDKEKHLREQHSVTDGITDTMTMGVSAWVRDKVSNALGLQPADYSDSRSYDLASAFTVAAGFISFRPGPGKAVIAEERTGGIVSSLGSNVAFFPEKVAVAVAPRPGNAAILNFVKPAPPGKAILPLYKPVDYYTGKPLKSGLRIYQEGKTIYDINPNVMLPSQSYVRLGKVQKYAEKMKLNGWGDFTPLDVVRMKDGRLFTFDHRRMAAAKMAGIDAKVVIHEAGEFLPNDFASTRILVKRDGTIATSWGEAIECRIEKQPKNVRELLRNGDWNLELKL